MVLDDAGGRTAEGKGKVLFLRIGQRPFGMFQQQLMQLFFLGFAGVPVDDHAVGHDDRQRILLFDHQSPFDDSDQGRIRKRRRQRGNIELLRKAIGGAFI